MGQAFGIPERGDCPFFIADGLHSYQDIPVLIGLEAVAGPAASEAQIFPAKSVSPAWEKAFLRERNWH